MRKAKSNAMLRGLASTALVLLISATAWGQKMKITGTVIDNTTLSHTITLLVLRPS